MAIARWDPIRELEEVERRLNTLFGRVPARRADGREENMTVFEWAPPVDIVESDNEYLIKVELPEIKREDVKVSIQNSTLMISGQRTIENEEKGRKYHRVERVYGHFARSFTLPEDADPSRIRAEFKDGVLNVHLAKAEHARPKRVDVEVA